uniref:Retrotransposon protein, putative, Ty3-gypsy subclass n=1 Tax=Oryza sativa subsp. japonica TaxID=39947 RepID=Q2QQW8_ORYSJ|nr:retrotransposon protein, putative, Ty3-gypsy subclass [Oryza sativa Japonica Group]
MRVPLLLADTFGSRSISPRRSRSEQALALPGLGFSETRVDNTNVFVTPQQNAVTAITLFDTIIDKAPTNVTPIMNKVKAMIATTVPMDAGGSRWPDESTVETPVGTHLPPLHSRDYWVPERSRGHIGSNLHVLNSESRKATSRLVGSLPRLTPSALSQ